MNNKFIIRKLEIYDYDKGYIDLLRQLTEVGNITKQEFITQYYLLLNNQYHRIYVIVDSIVNKVIASGTVFIEPKFIHGCGSVGHIEDIIINKDYRGQNLGTHLIKHLLLVSKYYKCYKVILNCDESNVKFYEKIGFQHKEICMRANL